MVVRWGLRKDNPLMFGSFRSYVVRFILRYRFRWLTRACQWQITIKCRCKFRWLTRTCQWQVRSCRWLNSYSWNTITAHRAHSRIFKTEIQRKIIKRLFFKSRKGIPTDNRSKHRGFRQSTDNLTTRRNRNCRSKNTRRTAMRRLTRSTKGIIKTIRLSTPRWHPGALQMSAICSGS